jgi:hypothetical protein
MQTENVAEKSNDIRERFGPQMERAKERALELNQNVVTFIRQHPGTCLLIGLGFGYLVGRLASRD